MYNKFKMDIIQFYFGGVMEEALIVVDMIHDFVDGKFGSDNAKSIVPKIKELIERARKKGILVPVILINLVILSLRFGENMPWRVLEDQRS